MQWKTSRAPLYSVSTRNTFGVGTDNYAPLEQPQISGGKMNGENCAACRSVSKCIVGQEQTFILRHTPEVLYKGSCGIKANKMCTVYLKTETHNETSTEDSMKFHTPRVSPPVRELMANPVTATKKSRRSLTGNQPQGMGMCFSSQVVQTYVSYFLSARLSHEP